MSNKLKLELILRDFVCTGIHIPCYRRYVKEPMIVDVDIFNDSNNITYTESKYAGPNTYTRIPSKDILVLIDN